MAALGAGRQTLEPAFELLEQPVEDGLFPALGLAQSGLGLFVTGGRRSPAGRFDSLAVAFAQLVAPVLDVAVDLPRAGLLRVVQLVFPDEPADVFGPGVLVLRRRRFSAGPRLAQPGQIRLRLPYCLCRMARRELLP